MDIKRTFDILPYALKNHPFEDCLAAKENGKWRKYSTQEFSNKVNQMSNALIEIGIQPGDKIASINNNRPEWNILNYAVSQIGAILCPMYPTISASDYVYIFNHSEVKYVFVSDEEILGLLNELIQDHKDQSNLKKIESLEQKLIDNLDENSFSELIKLKSQLNRD